MPGTGVDAAGRGAWPVVPGPAERVVFLEAQRRHRAALRRLHALGFICVLVLAVATGALLAATLAFVLAWARSAISVLADGSPAPVAMTPPLWRALAVAAAAAAVAVLGYWVVVWRFLRRAATKAAVQLLRARQPRAADFEEKQLVNVIEEIAIAAGIQPPAVRLVDSAAPNALAIGTGHDAGTIVVSRALLDRYDRDETQGLLAHLVASLGNGDGGAILTFYATGHALGLPAMLLVAPFVAETRAALFDAIRLERFRADASPRDITVATKVFTSADRGATRARGGAPAPDRPRPAAWGAVVLGLVLLPFLVWLLAVLLIVLVETMLFVPLAMRILRRRRLLADSDAVELTRNPDGLARALRRLADTNTDLSVGRWAALWAIVGFGPSAFPFGRSLFDPHPKVRDRIARLVQQGAASTG